MSSLDEVKAAKDVIQVLLKAKKAVRMYPENNPVYGKTVDDLFARLGDFFGLKEELSLRIRQHDLLVDSEVVYHNPEKDDNLALFFFKDGLRELTFKKDLSRQEIEEFLKIIALDFDREAVDDDIVTLFWERDFRNIKYVIDEDFLLEDDSYESQAVTSAKSKTADTDELLNAYADAFQAEEVKDVSIVNLSDKDLQMLVREVDRDFEDKSGKLSTILFEMLPQAESSTELEDVHRFLRNLAVYSLSQGNLNNVVEIFKRAKEMAENPSLPSGVRQHLNLLLSSVNSLELILPVGKALDSFDTLDEGVLAEYIPFLDRNAIAPFIAVLGEMKSIQGRKKAITVLIHIGKQDLQKLARGLQDTRWYVVRNIIYILRHIGDQKAVEYLLDTVRHPDVRVRKESIKTLGDLQSPLAVPTLRDCLDDPDPSTRLLAARSLSSIGSENAKRMLLERINGNEFRSRDFEEKRSFYEALARWNDTDVLNSLVRILKRRSFFKKARADEDRACAAHCLGLMGNHDALPVLSRLKGSKNRLLRDSVNAAIKRIEHAG